MDLYTNMINTAKQITKWQCDHGYSESDNYESRLNLAEDELSFVNTLGLTSHQLSDMLNSLLLAVKQEDKDVALDIINNLSDRIEYDFSQPYDLWDDSMK